MSRYDKTRWREKLRDLLLAAETTGVKQKYLVAKMEGLADAELVSAQLEHWLSEQKVQAFDLPSGPKGGRPARIWRATELMLEDKS